MPLDAEGLKNIVDEAVSHVLSLDDDSLDDAVLNPWNGTGYAWTCIPQDIRAALVADGQDSSVITLIAYCIMGACKDKEREIDEYNRRN